MTDNEPQLETGRCILKKLSAPTIFIYNAVSMVTIATKSPQHLFSPNLIDTLHILMILIWTGYHRSVDIKCVFVHAITI